MAKSVLVTGGAKSGKSLYAERRTLGLSGSPIYIATAEVRDGEMRDRIAAHRARRGEEWACVEEPTELLDVLRRTDGQGPRLVDCLTLWLTNLMLAEADYLAAIDEIAAALPDLQSPVVFVTNEVGSGIVPDNALARRFADAAGAMNQSFGDVAGEVILVVCGQPLKIKG